MNWHKHIERKFNIIIMTKKEKTQKTELRKEWKGTGLVYIYIVENRQETEQQKEYKQGQDEAQKRIERE